MSWATRSLYIFGAAIGFTVTLIMLLLSPPYQTIRWATTGHTLISNSLFGAFVAGWMTSLAGKRGSRQLEVVIGIVLFVFGFVALSSGHRYAMGVHPWKTSTSEMPISGVESIAVDRQGRIYLALGFYNRVQQYEADGRFMHGWFVDAGGGGISLCINGDQNLDVYTDRTNIVYTFNADGDMLSNYEVSTGFKGFEGVETMDTNGSRYEVAGRWLLPHVKRIDTQSVDAITVISTPWHQWIWMGPLPAWVIMLAGLMMMIWAQRIDRRQLAERLAKPA